MRENREISIKSKKRDLEVNYESKYAYSLNSYCATLYPTLLTKEI